MAVTALKVTDENGTEQRMLFMTVQKESGVDVDIILADENFEPYGNSSLGVSKLNEEEYHTQLRKESSEKGHFVPDFSSHPEWNPQ